MSTSRKFNTNVGLFASSKQHSLFPLTIPCPNISKEEYRIFYYHERRLFTVLLVFLYREVVQSTLILGFLLWLEREGYTSKNLVQTIVDSLSLAAIDLVIDEAVICLKCVEKKDNKFLLEGYDVVLLNNILDRKKISLKELHENRYWIFNEVSRIAKDVCAKAFDDILSQFMRRGVPSTIVSPNRPLVPFGNANGVLLNPIIDFGQYNNLFPNGPPSIKEEDHEVSPDDRTIFLTFSKGYPISEGEVRDYFTSYFGDFIETIYMHEVGPDEQPLYARIVACSHTMVKVIVERDGRDGKSKYNINGKHVWARKYVKKKPARVLPTQPLIAPPQP